MVEKMRALLRGECENHLAPFFWQHGEDEATLREYMAVIQNSGCGAVCVESRPHPDFCGPGWWRDMDVILDEARRRGMKVWILDDSHFPTGFANGAVKDAPPELHRQSVCAARADFDGPAGETALDVWSMIPPPFHPASVMERYVFPSLVKDAPRFDDDRVIAATAVNRETGEAAALPLPAPGLPLRWQKPEGAWTVWVVGLSRNCGPHREYINMLDPRSCKLLLDAVYEPHWAHYRADFGKTIAGFFSDEPELGNGHIFFSENPLGTDQNLPFAVTLPPLLERSLGKDWAGQLYLLWDNGGDPRRTAQVRCAYMDAVTRQVRDSFSRQIGSWCRAHGVEYTGHIIEDNNAHARTGVSLGHYFRGLDGQDMAGIDDIGGQVLPQGEDKPNTGALGMARDGEFYHYMLGNLAASAAAIQPEKRGRAMCEIFGNYGWAEGVRLEKYLADHFLARGINCFVPHAFSPAPFPDPDCPPHFYAHGHNPQYRHFGALMGYMNRVATLTSGGRRVAPVAILYHGEAEWAGRAMLSQKPARALAEAQIEYDCVPCDVFAERSRYKTVLGSPLRINTQSYRALIIPYAQFVPAAFARAAAELHRAGLPVLFLGGLPEGVCDGDDGLLASLADCPVPRLEGLAAELNKLALPEAVFAPASTYLRAMHYQGECGLFYFVNEGAKPYAGAVTIPYAGPCYWYDPWANAVHPVRGAPCGDGTCLDIALEPSHSLILLLDEADEALLTRPVRCAGRELALKPWTRSTCAAIDYPRFAGAKPVLLPDDLAREQPDFSGFARYENAFDLPGPGRVALEITDACEGVEVFVNGGSAGIQIVPPFRYDLTPLARPGRNEIAIEAATTLERYCYSLTKDDPRMKLRGLAVPSCGSGITGCVSLFFESEQEDLYYRLRVVPIHIPALRERTDDIIPLVKLFLARYNKKYESNKDLSHMAYRVLHQYEWPGNVRELKNVIERMVVMSDGDTITAEELPMYQERFWGLYASDRNLSLKELLEKAEYMYMTDAYKKYKSVRKAAAALQMTMPTFIRKRQKYEEKYPLQK